MQERRRNGFGSRCGLALLLGLLASCHALGEAPGLHIVQFDGEGRAVRPTTHFTGWFRPLHPRDDAEHEGHLTRMLDALATEAPRDEAGRPRVMLFIHGGLNDQVSTVERALHLTDPILADGYWPIFLNWQSSLLSSYSDHLFFVRQGENWGAWGPLLSPLYLITDLALGLARAPLVAYSQIGGLVRAVPAIVGGEERAVQRVLGGIGLPSLPEGSVTSAEGAAQAAGEEPGVDRPGIEVSIGEDSLGGWGITWDFLQRFITVPLKVVQEPFLAGMGQGAWNNMQRRVYLLFHSEEEFLSGARAPGKRGLPRFLERLRAQQETEDLQITLIVHSMGAIVANEILRQEPDLEFAEIVYMAAACSIRDYEATVFPYLRRHEATEFYHLTLHPKAEVREAQWLDLTARGSLLVWVDGFLANPLTPLDRTVGNFNNLVLALPTTPAELRGRIHVKAFATGPDAGEDVPQEHGELTEVPFWTPAFRAPDR